MSLWQSFVASFDERNFRKCAPLGPPTFKSTQEETGSGIPDVSFQDNTVLERERQRQDTINAIKEKFGKSAAKAWTLLETAASIFRLEDTVVEKKPMKTKWVSRQRASARDAFAAQRHYEGHPRMSRASRAKIFMPFDALKGLREALAERQESKTI